MVRLKDIARQAGVSVMTVSKALRDEPDVSAATKARLKALALQMGYVPDSSAQGLRTKTTRMFGLVIPSITDPIFARIVFAIEDRAHELGYDILLAHTLNQSDREEQCIRRLLSRRVDGLFISPVYRFSSEARIYQEIQARKTPVVLLGPPALFCKNFPGAEVDELVASYNVTHHLLKLGHKRIAYLTGPQVAPWAHERFEGYRRALREANLDVDDRLVFQAGGTIDDGTKAALQMLNETCDATAVQAVNDLVAIGCATALMAQGLKIPDDLSVAGFGNILLTENFRVPLTTVRQPKLRLGVAAMEMMMQLLRGEHPQTRRIPAELLPRESTAAPKVP
ncbi:MAG TPA: LacI family DNA-binding transcriptional regulator [Verrucomicrobiae bacterium]|jgi:LacI family transcriptional regulator|nr:LacI family DNA-binding transcriptional regulator [Verrucomicrobiae bacterium]